MKAEPDSRRLGKSLAEPAASGTGVVRVAGLEVREELGRGARAVVFRARRGGVDYALKMLRSDVGDRRQSVAAFRREAAMLACVEHPAVGRVYEVGDRDGDPYLVMELLVGRSLAEVLDDGRLAPLAALRTVAHLAEALAAAHRVGVVHRDVKPENIMVVAGGQPKLIDFGLATRNGYLPVDSEVAGTLAYAAPEQTGMLARPVDGRSDLYALGVVLFECLTGRRPFEAADAGELVRLHAVAVPPDVSTLCSDLPPGVSPVVNRLLAKDPDDRYQDGEDLAGDLHALVAATSGVPADASAGTVKPGTRRSLVGRTAELSHLMAGWRQARLGSVGVLRVTGGAGAGKTRLVEEFGTRIRTAGYPVLTVSCSASGAPMAALRTGLDRFVSEMVGPADDNALTERLRGAAGPGASVLRLVSPALGRVLDAPKLADEERQEQTTTAAAAFLARLARLEDGLLVVLDDAHLADRATAAVLRQLTSAMRDCPLLVVATEPAGTADGTVPPWLDLLADGVVDATVELAPLTERDIAALVRGQLGGADVTAELVGQLTVRSGGNPFAAVEYLRVLIDSGVIRPSWGSWTLDEAELDALTLPEGVLNVVIARIDALADGSRDLLTAAAAAGVAFQPDLIAEICRTPTGTAMPLLQEAVARGVLERRGAEGYAFLHARAREALLSGLDEPARRRLYQRIATVLDDAGPTERQQWYAIAKHYASGELDETTERMFRACCTAAETALGDQAPADAMDYLRMAAEAADRGSFAPDSRFYRCRGLAQMRLGSLDDAVVSLDAAVAGETDPLRRAESLAFVAQAQHMAYASDRSEASVRRGLTELGWSLPANPVLLALSTVMWFVAGILVQRTGKGFGTVEGAQRERYRLLAGLHQAGAMAAAVGMRRGLMIAFHLRSLYIVQRLGPGPEYARTLAALGLMAGMAKLRGVSSACHARAQANATATNDPRLVAYVAWIEAIGDSAAAFAPTTGAPMRALLQVHGQWLEPDHYLSSIAALGMSLLFRGYANEAMSWQERGEVRMASAVNVQANPAGMLGVWVAAATGDRGTAGERLATRDELSQELSNDVGQRVNVLMAAVFAAAEHAGFDDALEAAVTEIRQSRIRPRRVWPQQRALWLYLARARLRQLRTAPDEQRRREQARQAVAELRRVANVPALRAYARAAFAEYLTLTGAPERALRELNRAEAIGQPLDLPLLSHEVAVTRARAMRSLGHQAEAGRQATHAIQLAAELGMEHRARAVRADFKAGQSVETAGPRTARPAGSATSVGVHHRRLAALQEVSLAAATVLEPRQLARVALDETIRIFAAERAILFLTDPTNGQLRPHLGRSATGADVDDIGGYGSTLLEQVRQTGEALVVTSAEHGAALGSRSVVAHGLRSVMVAPLRMKGQLLGMVYLDSRVAKGVFTNEDVDILTAITNQVAASFVTAQTAQLEAAVEVARRQSELADTMRSSMAEVSRTLDPDDVIQRLLATLVRVSQADRAIVVGPDRTVRALATAGSASTRTGDDAAAQFDPADPALAELLGSVEVACFGTAGGHTPIAGVLAGVRSWIAVPLVSRERMLGLVLLTSGIADVYDEGRVKVVAALCEQGMVAYDNAQLFSRVEQLASTDPLTGLHNRRYFFELAAGRLAAAKGSGQPLSAMMVDIDHFKRINDTHGHAVGDEVIREVSARLRANVTVDDIVGRYGGEEFALILDSRSRRAPVQVAETVRAAIADAPIQTRIGPVPVTVSAGYTELAGRDTGIDDVLCRADDALYQAKQRGRNRVEVA